MAFREPKPGEQTVQIGGVAYVRSPGQQEIGRSGEWILHKLPRLEGSEWDNLKLYRDCPGDGRHVWHLGLKGKVFSHSKDLVNLDVRFPGVAEWVRDAALGLERPAPVFGPSHKAVRLDAKYWLTTLPPDAMPEAFDGVDAAWKRKNPWTLNFLGKRAGRYGPELLAKRLQCPVEAAKALLQSMEKQGIIVRDMACKKNKVVGFRVAGLLLKGSCTLSKGVL